MERLATYNADDSKPYIVTELRVFGSYLDAARSTLGDLDLHLTFHLRDPHWSEAGVMGRYSRESGRRFNSFLEEVYWPHSELLRTLRGRSPYIHITTEDLTNVTDRWQVLYQQSNL